MKHLRVEIAMILRLFGASTASAASGSARSSPFAIVWGTLSILLLMSFGAGHEAISSTGGSQRHGGEADHGLRRPDATTKPTKACPRAGTIQFAARTSTPQGRGCPRSWRIAPESYTLPSRPRPAGTETVNRDDPRDDRGVRRDARPSCPRRAAASSTPLDRRREAPKVAFIGGKLARGPLRHGGSRRRAAPSDQPRPLPGDRGPGEEDPGFRCTTARTPNQVYLPFHRLQQHRSTDGASDQHPHPSPGGLQPVEAQSRRGCGPRARPQVPLRPRRQLRLGIWNTIENAKEGAGHLHGIEIFLGIIGALTLLIGAVGVTNLMYAVGQGADPGDRGQAGHRGPATDHRRAVLPGDGVHLRERDVLGLRHRVQHRPPRPAGPDQLRIVRDRGLSAAPGVFAGDLRDLHGRRGRSSCFLSGIFPAAPGLAGQSHRIAAL